MADPIIKRKADGRVGIQLADGTWEVFTPEQYKIKPETQQIGFKRSDGQWEVFPSSIIKDEESQAPQQSGIQPQQPSPQPQPQQQNQPDALAMAKWAFNPWTPPPFAEPQAPQQPTAQDMQFADIGRATATAPGPINYGVNIAQQVVGAIPGYDEYAAGVNALVSGIPVVGQALYGQVPEGDIGQRYDAWLAKERAQNQTFSEQNPIASTGANIAGGIGAMALAPGLTGARFVAGAKGLPSLIGKGALVGAGQGAAYGFGAGEGGLENRLAGAEEGAMWGGALGAALPAAGAAAKGIGGLAGKLTSPIVNRAGDALAGRSAAEAARRQALVKQLAPEAADQAATQARAEALASRRIGRTLKRDQIPDAETLAARLDEVGPGAVPADLGPNLRAELQTVSSMPGEARGLVESALTQRASARNPRIMQAASDALGLKKSASELMGELDNARSLANQQISGMLKKTAFIRSVPQAREIVSDIDKSLKTAKGDIANTLTRAKNLFLQNDGRLDQSFNGLYETKKALDDMITKARSAVERGGPNAKLNEVKSLENIRGQLNAALRSASPDYEKTMRQFADQAQERELFETGAGFFKEAGDSISAAELKTLVEEISENPHKKLAFRQGVLEGVGNFFSSAGDETNQARKLLGTEKYRRALAIAFDDPVAYQKIEKALKAEKTFTETLGSALKGSQTQQRLAAMGDYSADQVADFATSTLTGQSPMTALINAGIGKIGGLIRGGPPDEATRAAMARLLLESDPKKLQSIMPASDAARRQALTRQILSR